MDIRRTLFPTLVVMALQPGGGLAQDALHVSTNHPTTASHASLIGAAGGQTGGTALQPADDSGHTKQARQPAKAAAEPHRETKVVQAPAATNTPSGTDPAAILAGAKPDILQQAQESPATTLRDAFRMLLYLLPILVLVVLAIRGLKALQQRAGRLPGFRQGLIGGFNLTNGRKTGGSSIRLLESVPIGSIVLHLVEVRGRTLLLGASTTSVSKLMEFGDAAEARDAEFQTMLAAISHDMESDPDAAEGGLGNMVGSLDDSLRETREAIARSAARARKREG